jgi:hypothetical protein
LSGGILNIHALNNELKLALSVVSNLIFVIGLVAVALGAVVVTQAEQIGDVMEETMKPSATDCKFSGQRLSEKYYCTYRNVNGQQYLDVEHISENQIPTCNAVSLEGSTIDANGVGSTFIKKDSGCIATITSITLKGIPQITENIVLKETDTRVFFPLNAGVTFPEGSQITFGITAGKASAVQSVKVLPAGTSRTVNPSTTINSSTADQQQQLTYAVTGGKEILSFQRIFVRELFNSDVSLPSNTGIHTSNAKSVSVAVEAKSLVTVTIEGTDCVIQGSSFDRICDVPSNTDVKVYVDGSDQAHVILRLHYII